MIDFRKMAEEINRMEWAQSLRTVKTEKELRFWRKFFESKKKKELVKMIDEAIEGCEGVSEIIPTALKEYFDELALRWYEQSIQNRN